LGVKGKVKPLRNRILIILLTLSFIPMMGCSDPFLPKHITGTVAEAGQATWVRTGESSGREKYAILLTDIVVDCTGGKLEGQCLSIWNDVAGSTGGVALECWSTRCSLLKPGACAEFHCAREVRWFEPDVMRCKLKREHPEKVCDR